MVHGYIGRCVVALSELQVTLEESNHDDLRSFGHRLKGSAGSYGLPELSRIGKDLELAAAGNDLAAIKLRVVELEKYLSRLDCAGSAERDSH